MKTIYISGKITGLEIKEAKAIFNRVELYLIKRGYNVINPLKLKHKRNATWQENMKTDIVELLKCDAIFMLDNWLDSDGAKLENYIAKKLGLEVIYYEI